MWLFLLQKRSSFNWPNSLGSSYTLWIVLVNFYIFISSWTLHCNEIINISMIFVYFTNLLWNWKSLKHGPNWKDFKQLIVCSFLREFLKHKTVLRHSSVCQNLNQSSVFEPRSIFVFFVDNNQIAISNFQFCRLKFQTKSNSRNSIFLVTETYEW